MISEDNTSTEVIRSSVQMNDKQYRSHDHSSFPASRDRSIDRRTRWKQTKVNGETECSLIDLRLVIEESKENVDQLWHRRHVKRSEVRRASFSLLFKNSQASENPMGTTVSKQGYQLWSDQRVVKKKNIDVFSISLAVTSPGEWLYNLLSSKASRIEANTTLLDGCVCVCIYSSLKWTREASRENCLEQSIDAIEVDPKDAFLSRARKCQWAQLSWLVAKNILVNVYIKINTNNSHQNSLNALTTSYLDVLNLRNDAYTIRSLMDPCLSSSSSSTRTQKRKSERQRIARVQRRARDFLVTPKLVDRGDICRVSLSFCCAYVVALC